MNDTTIAAEVRSEFIADHRQRVARTEGELSQRARDVRDHLNVLTQHQQRAYREDVIGTLGALNYCLGTHSTGHPAIYWNPCAESELAEMLMVLGTDLMTREPRKWASMLASVRLDVSQCVLWFELPCEPADIPYGAAA